MPLTSDDERAREIHDRQKREGTFFKAVVHLLVVIGIIIVLVLIARNFF